ncbi:hypothetical protein [Arcanobacterium phocae]|nr:hypothetical protein [Arcanobacterium phocae]
MSSKFKESDIRVGWLIDPDSSTLLYPATIQYTAKGVVGIINLSIIDSNGYYREHSSQIGRNSVPETMYFSDAYGRVCLWRCRNYGLQATAYGSELKFFARIAVNSDSFYTQAEITSMVTKARILDAWFNLGKMNASITRTPHTRFESNILVSDPVPLSPLMHLKATSRWETYHNSIEFNGNICTTLESHSDPGAEFGDHYQVHQNLYTLFAISAWKPCFISKLLIQANPHNESDLIPFSDLEPVYVSERFISYASDAPEVSFLFSHEDLQEDSYNRWLQLCDHQQRIVESLVNVLYSADPWNPEFILTLGPVLERIGLEIAKKSEDSKYFSSRKGQVPFKSALKAIIDQLPLSPLDDPNEWIVHTHEAYTSWKHADRKLASRATVLSAIKESLMIIRFWICHKIGVDLSDVQERLHSDSLYQIHFR